jgi:hypothetical protein
MWLLKDNKNEQMKKLFFFITASFIGYAAAAQPVVMLHHAGTVSGFYGNSGFQEAYTAASAGDTIYLPGGFFYPPNLIDKGLQIYGAGHYPDSTVATTPTTILQSMTIGENADNLHLEGFVVTGDLGTAYNAIVNNIILRRLAFNNMAFSGNRENPCINGMIDQCIVYGNLNLENASYLTIRGCIINAGVMNLYNSIMNNSILLAPGRSIHYASASTIRNNIILYPPDFYQSINNLVQNNLFTNTPDLSGNTLSGNYFNVTLANVFVNYGNDGFKYTYNFHLKTPASYPGTDATQVGVYGTSQPFKEGSVPANPHIQTKAIAEQTNAEGKIQVQVKVAAQNN